MKKFKKITVSIGIIAVSFVSVFSAIQVANSSFGNNKTTTISSANNITKVSPYAVGSFTETQTTFAFRNNSDIPWAGTLRADEVSPEDLLIALRPADTNANFFVQIQAVTQSDLNNGIVRFTLTQNLRTYTNGIQTSIRQVPIAAPAGLGTGNIWQTPSGLVISQLFSFAFASDQAISDYIFSTQESFATLSRQDVIENIFSSTANLPNADNIILNFSDIQSGVDSRGRFGVGRLVVSFTGINNNQWAGGAPPTNTTIILRGLITNDGTREVMRPQFNSELSNRVINTAGLAEYSRFLTSTTNATFGDLFASQFLSANNGSNATLISILTNNLYSTSTTPIASLVYMGVSSSDPNFAAVTGLPAATVNQIRFNSVEPSIQDAQGSMSLVYNYSFFDVMTNAVRRDGIATENFPNDTFQRNPDAGKNLTFEWKTDNMVASSSSFAGIGTSSSIVTDFFNNRDDALFLRNLSNKFFDGSADTRSQAREVTIQYGLGNMMSNGNVVVENGVVQPLSANDDTVTVTLRFDSWNGNIYTETVNGQLVTRRGFLTSRTFDLNRFTNTDVANISLKSQTSLFTDVPILSTLTPSDVAFAVSQATTENPGVIQLDDFFATPPNLPDGLRLTPIFTPNDQDGSLTLQVYVHRNNQPVSSNVVFEQFYSGFRTAPANGTIEFSWIPQSAVSSELLNQDIEDVTVQDVIDSYLRQIPLFANSTLNSENVTLSIDQNNPSILIVSVTIPEFNQSQANPGVQTFRTTISGFGTVTSGNTAEFDAPENFTVLITVILTTVASITMGTLLVFFLVKQFGTRRHKHLNGKLKTKKPIPKKDLKR